MGKTKNAVYKPRFSYVQNLVLQCAGSIKSIVVHSILREHRTSGDNGEHHGIDECVCRQRRNRCAKVGINNFRRGDCKNLLVLYGVNVFRFEQGEP